MKLLLTILLIGLFLISTAQLGLSEESQEPLWKAYQEHFKKDYFSIGALMQYVFDYQNERTLAGNNGFSIANMRLLLKGKFDSGFGYFFQTNFVSSPAILDAYMNYSQSAVLQLQIGQFKAPFSKELLTPASAIDFVNRSRVVAALAPGRQIGFQLSGHLHENGVQYRAGIFNGNGVSANNNDNDDFLFAGRLAFFPKISESATDYLEIGVNVAYSKDGNVGIVSGLLPRYRSERLLMGGDVRFIFGNLLIAGEYIHANLEPNSGSVKFNPSGFQTTAGYMATPKIQLLVRWDNFDSDNLSAGNGKSDWFIWGINIWPTSITELQFNYVLDMDNENLENHQILVNAQVAL